MATKTSALDGMLQADTSDDPISQQVIEAVADAKGVDPLDLPPLYDSVDPDALDSLFGHDGSSAAIASLTVEIGDCEVTIRGSGDVVVRSDAVDAEADSVPETPRDSVADRCGVDVGDTTRNNTHHS